MLAQALRIGTLLGAHRPGHAPDPAALARMRDLLARQVQAPGAVAFAVDAPAASCNVWAAMFADQALAFAADRSGAAAWRRGDPLLV